MSSTARSQSSANTVAEQLLAALVKAKAITPQQAQASLRTTVAVQPPDSPSNPHPFVPPSMPVANPTPTPSLTLTTAPPNPAASAPVPAPSQPDPGVQRAEKKSPQNPAVLACINAWLTREEELLRTTNLSERERKEQGRAAFRMAMPPLDTRQNIRDFIACVTRGMLNGAIDTHVATKYLYAAQIAHLASEPVALPVRQPGRPPKQDSQLPS